MTSSTGHFPGAPINTEPITTMATSTSEPITSPSTASQVTPQAAPVSEGAPPSVPSVPPPPSGDPKATASEEPRAASSASNPGGTEPPGTTDPGSTATTSTATTTTATTSTTGTGPKDTTTTTTSTTTVATGRATPPVPQETLFQDMIKRANNCLFLVRKLRTKQDLVSNICMDNTIAERELPVSRQMYIDAQTMMQDLMVLYEKLDQICRRLPKVVPPIDNINVMRTLYAQEHTMCHTGINKLFEQMIDCGNWNEGNFQIFHYLAELLRVSVNRKPNRYPDKLVLPKVGIRSGVPAGHIAFENAYKMMRKEIVNKSLGIYPKILNRSTSGFVVEFLFGHGGTKVIYNRDIIFTMKFLLVERNGIIEYINMIAPHELWSKRRHFNGHYFVDPFADSSYEVYRRLTRQANIHLQNCFGTHASRWTALTLLQFISIFGKFREVFTSRCRVCRRNLKNFLPPLIFDIRTPTIACHEACR